MPKRNLHARAVSSEFSEREPEVIPLTDGLCHRLMAVKYGALDVPTSKLDLFYTITVHAVYPCPGCHFLVCFARVGQETLVLDAFTASDLPGRWLADPVMGTHSCALGGL